MNANTAGDNLDMTLELPKLIASSVVRGDRRVGSHGGVYTIDFEKQAVDKIFDLDESDIDFKGSSGDRGMRGIAIADGDILIASSGVLFRCDPNFEIKTFSRNHYLDNCHEICQFEQTIFLASQGCDSLLAFDLESRNYIWGFHLTRQYDEWSGHTFDPQTDKGPAPVNDYLLNMVHVDDTGIYFSGQGTKAMLHLDNDMKVSEICSLPAGAHNARPYRDGVLFNDTNSDCVRYVGRDGESLAFKTEAFDDSDIDFADVEDADTRRQGFARGLCTIGDRFIAAGSSPSTISLYDFESEQKVGSVNLSLDIRNTIHGLTVWPFDD